MRSPRGFFAALVLLLALPLTALYQMFFDNGAGTVIHVALAAGFVLISFSVFDFKIPRWITWIGCASTGALAAIFLLQGVSELIQNNALTHLVFQVLGQRLEAWLVDLFVFWCIAMLLMDSEGKARILGFVAMSVVVCLKLYAYSLIYLGTSLEAKEPSLKVLYLLLFVWLLFESKKKISLEV
ncbi:MAG: hypothetical protein ACREOO_07520 [bacterium]